MSKILVVAKKGTAIPGVANGTADSVTEIDSADDVFKLLRNPAVQFDVFHFDPAFVEPLCLPLISEVLKRSPLCRLVALAPHSVITPEIAVQLKINVLGSKEAAPDLHAKGKIGEKKTGKEPEDYLAITLPDLPRNEALNFSLYVKVGANHFVRLVNEGDSLDDAQVTGYGKKGVQQLYVERQDLQEYVVLLTRLARILGTQPEQDWQKCIDLVAAQGDAVIKTLGYFGLGEKNLLLAREFLSNVEDTIFRMNKKNKCALDGIFQNLGFYNHMVSVVLVAAAFIDRLGYSRDRSIKNIGLACLLHDFSLFSESEALQSEDLDKMDDAERERFFTHPILSKNLVSKIEGIDPIVLQGIEQHHERRTGKGFPKNLGPGQIHPVAEVIGLSDDFVWLVASEPGLSKQQVQMKLRNSVYDGFSSQVVDAFEKALFS